MRHWESEEARVCDRWLTRWTRDMSNQMLIFGRIATAISRNSNNLSNSEHITEHGTEIFLDIDWSPPTRDAGTWREYTGPGASNNDITSSDISGHGEIVIEHLTMAVWIASCFFFSFITNFVILMVGVMMIMMFTMCLSSVATNCHRKSEDIRPGAHFSPSSATLRVSRAPSPESWDQHQCRSCRWKMIC